MGRKMAAARLLAVFLLSGIVLASSSVRIAELANDDLGEGLGVGDAEADVEAEELVDYEGEEGNPVVPNPLPRDYYILPNTRQGGGDLECQGQLSMPVPTGNLLACAESCNDCHMCKGWVYDDASGGKGKWKNVVPEDPCMPPECNQDSYAKCPRGRWSDGLSSS